MLILSLETSGPTACVALMRDGILLAELAVHHTRTHSETMMPMAEILMGELALTPQMLGALAVNIGPGSFTGIRIGVCAANAMGQALQIPVVGIDSLSALYENVACYPGWVCALIDARNGSAYAAQFCEGGMVEKPEAVTVLDYVKTLPPNTLFVGDGAMVYEKEIRASVAGCRVAPTALHASRAGSLCHIAHAWLQLGKTEQDVQAQPLYLRVSQAERMWELQHGEQAADAGERAL